MKKQTSKPEDAASLRQKAENSLSESHQFHSQIINCVHEGIIVYDHNLKYQLWNPFMENFSGLPASEVIGKHPLDLFPFLKEAGVIGILEKALNGEINYGVDFPFTIPATGITGWASETTFPLYNTNNEIIGVISIVQDITRRKQSEEKISEQIVELKRWYNVLSDREEIILKVKSEVNELLAQAGKPPRYESAI